MCEEKRVDVLSDLIAKLRDVFPFPSDVDRAEIIHSPEWCLEAMIRYCGWQPMDTAPKDKEILVYHKHESDPYDLGEGRITTYAAHIETIGVRKDDGLCIAIWGGGWYEYDEFTGNYTGMPDWWFFSDDDYETPLAPICWMPLPPPPPAGSP